MLQICWRTFTSSRGLGIKKSCLQLHMTSLQQCRTYRTKGSKNKATLAIQETTNLLSPKSTGKSEDAGAKAEHSPSASVRYARAQSRRSNTSKTLSPIIITPGSPHHSDLASFLSYTKRTGLSPTSTVYIGTHYEYTVAEALVRLGFNLTRTGRQSDRGIDLIGTWTLPIPSSLVPHQDLAHHHRPQEELRVIIQCKAHTSTRPIGPSHIRELEGAMSGAPPGFRGPHVLAFLAASTPGTKGMQEALMRSRLPMGFMCIASGISSPTTKTIDSGNASRTDGKSEARVGMHGANERAGRIHQILWNEQAVGWGLEGVGVTTRFTSSPCSQGTSPVGREVEADIGLTYNGSIL